MLTACPDWVFLSIDSLGALFSLFALGKFTVWPIVGEILTI